MINLSLISNKTQNLLFSNFPEINTVSNTNLILLLNIRGIYKFGLSLKTATIRGARNIFNVSKKGGGRLALIEFLGGSGFFSVKGGRGGAEDLLKVILNC